MNFSVNLIIPIIAVNPLGTTRVHKNGARWKSSRVHPIWMCQCAIACHAAQSTWLQLGHRAAKVKSAATEIASKSQLQNKSTNNKAYGSY